MPRRARELRERGVYHVHCATLRAEPVFADQEAVRAWLAVLREVTIRDRWSVLAWCVLPERFHLAVRTTRVPLARSMRQLQGRFAREQNRCHGQRGPLWQGRYQARTVEEDEAPGLIEWIHAAAIRRGAAAPPGACPCSGHGELSGEGDGLIVDLEAALQIYADEADRARSAYLRGILRAANETSLEADHEALPWWRRRAALVSNPGKAALVLRIKEEEFLARACQALGTALERIAGRRRDRETARLRELVALVGVESCGARACELARVLGMHPDWVSHLASRGAARRASDPVFAEAAERLSAEVRGAAERDLSEAAPAPAARSGSVRAENADWAPWM